MYVVIHWLMWCVVEHGRGETCSFTMRSFSVSLVREIAVMANHKVNQA